MSVRHRLQVHDVVPWAEFNEYEGEIHGELDGVPVHAYVLVAPVEQWEEYRPGATLEVEAWIERSGGISPRPSGEPSELTQVDGVVYDVAGRIMEVDGDELRLGSTPPLRVDLDLPGGAERPRLKVGDGVRVRGILKVDLPDDE